ncbi:hypothetical protein LXT21_02160 [Myxococcus sp. K38C18041901]|uniref:hypothetical protein n=1 Tax=Myxococcus guangdongensis TaxID=2906760 RepID=UPI0020A701FC|nr:hypothetical protein [Myxococcus guangdongensis]MCP3057575.1 hypothetical protein [Myxococcus guangdongensis]
MSPKTSALEPLRVRIRRFQFIVGLGFIALVLGSTLSVSLTLRLSQRVQSLSFAPLKILVAVLLENLWLLAVLPTLCYGAGRVMELRPWKTAAGAAVSGATFVLALGFVQSGADSLWLGGLGSVLNVVAFAGGVVLSARALKLGRDAAAKQTEKTQAKSESRKSEYDEFLRAAEQGGARLEQREAQVASAQAAATPSLESAPAAEAPSVAAPVVTEEAAAVVPAPSAVETLGASTTSATTEAPLGEALPGQVIRLPEQSLSAQAPEAPESPKPPVP